jgi:hypothetical protein
MTNVDANVGSYEYDLLYATRETDGGSGYITVIDYVKQFIEDVHAGDVDNFLEVIHSDQASFEQYLPDDDIDEEIPEEETNSQSSLTDFR